MGVGGFKELSNVRTRVNTVIVSQGLRPESGRPGGLNPRSWCPTHPAEPAELVLEVSSNDNRRIFWFTDAGLQHVLCVSQVTCLAGSGAVNNSKLKAYCLEAKPDAIAYGKATVDMTVGTIKAESGGLEMVKVPIVMGEAPRSAFTKYSDALKHLL